MKLIAALFFLLFTMPGVTWLTNFEEAHKMAQEKNRFILLNFSGSDWCGPCIRMKTEIFKTKSFENFADSTLVLLNADFPRSNRNKLSEQQVKQNEQLADRYNPKGKFPLTLLLDREGKILQEWDGMPANGAPGFIEKLQTICHGNK